MWAIGAHPIELDASIDSPKKKSSEALAVGKSILEHGLSKRFALIGLYF